MDHQESSRESTLGTVGEDKVNILFLTHISLFTWCKARKQEGNLGAIVQRGQCILRYKRNDYSTITIRVKMLGMAVRIQ